jgi:hypothetical protein
MPMNTETLANKYINSMEATLKNVKQARIAIKVSPECIDEVYGYVKAYLQDAKYFLQQKNFDTSLTSIAYCEGLLDALKLIGAIEIQTI